MSEPRRTATTAPRRRSTPGRAPAAPSPTRRRRWRRALLSLAVAGLLATVAWALLGSQFFVVRAVRVTGTGRLVSRARVLAAAAIPAGLPLLRLDGAAVVRRVGALRQVASVSVSTDWPGTVVIAVRPRVPVFVMARPGGFELVDASGVSLATRLAGREGYPVLAVGGGIWPRHLRNSPALRAAAAVLAELPAGVARRVASVSVAATGGVSLKLADGALVEWGNAGNGAVKARELAVLLRRHARLYDVSAPGMAVTKG